MPGWCCTEIDVESVERIRVTFEGKRLKAPTLKLQSVNHSLICVSARHWARGTSSTAPACGPGCGVVHVNIFRWSLLHHLCLVFEGRREAAFIKSMAGTLDGTV